MNALRIALCSMLLLVTSSPLMAQGTYTQIDYPEASQTFCLGINSAGDIVGFYISNANGFYHGFLLRSGIFYPIDDPATPDTAVQGINDNNQLVGSTEFHGFVYDFGTSVFTDISYPGSLYTQTVAINNDGTMVGTYTFAGQLGQGYELVGSNFFTIMPHGSTFQTALTGISDTAEIVGTGYQSTTKYINFDFQNGVYHKLLPKVTSAHVLGINPTGTTIVGAIGSTVGFVQENGQQNQLLRFPGANDTPAATGVNSAGTVVGWFHDSSLVAHGFMWTPSAAAPSQ